MSDGSFIARWPDRQAGDFDQMIAVLPPEVIERMAAYYTELAARLKERLRMSNWYADMQHRRAAERDEQRRAVRSMVAQLAMNPAMAMPEGMSPASWMEFQRRATKQRRTTATAERNARILRMAHEGRTLAQIGAAERLHPVTVSKIISRIRDRPPTVPG